MYFILTEKHFIEAVCNRTPGNCAKIKQGVYLFPYQNKKYIIKTKSTGFLKKLTQRNENEFYKKSTKC